MTSKDEVSISKMCMELEEVAQLCHDELGEWWSGLAGVYDRARDCGSEGFLKSLESEIASEYRRLKHDFKIVKRTEAITETVVFIDLVHVSEME